MAPRLILLGWDSATFDIVDPLRAKGRLPVLASIIERGARASLRSTWPPMTDCAWTSAFTGRNPGAHGIFGSWYRAPGAYECRYFSSRDRRVPAVWEFDGDIDWLVWNVPMSFPPARIRTAMVAGYGAPPGARFCEPGSLQDELAERWPLDDILDRAPHGSLDTFLADLLRGLQVQAEALPWAIRTTECDVAVAVWPHIDRAQHFFWRFRDTDHHLASAVDEVYAAMDRATGQVMEEFPNADLVVVSDHGAGPLQGDVNMGEVLTRYGYAHRGVRNKVNPYGWAWKLPPAVRKLGRKVAPGAARRAMGRTLTGQLGSFEWAETSAFVGWHGDLWLNVAGREPAGMVAAEQAAAVEAELSELILDLRDPETGVAPFHAVHRRDDIYAGPAIDLAPDLMLDSWSAGYRVSPNRDAADDLIARPSPLAGVDEAWSADHRPLGIFAAAGPHIKGGTFDELSLLDVAPTMLALLGEPVPDGLDGRPCAEVMTEAHLASSPVTTGGVAPERSGGGEFSDEEADAVAAHLRDLGYIE
jgi:predicted AlkP superfamily phosphohydrolase/phosphomutase